MRIFVTALVMLIGLCGSGVALRAEQPNCKVAPSNGPPV